jgi:hypothetical protein
METTGNTLRNTTEKGYLLEKEMAGMLDIAKQAVAPNQRLRGQGPIALTLATERGWGVRAISRFLTTHGLSVSPAAVSKFLSAERAKAPQAAVKNTPYTTPNK